VRTDESRRNAAAAITALNAYKNNRRASLEDLNLEEEFTAQFEPTSSCCYTPSASILSKVIAQRPDMVEVIAELNQAPLPSEAPFCELLGPNNGVGSDGDSGSVSDSDSDELSILDRVPRPADEPVGGYDTPTCNIVDTLGLFADSLPTERVRGIDNFEEKSFASADNRTRGCRHWTERV
jgi:hypothetical protein